MRKTQIQTAKLKPVLPPWATFVKRKLKQKAELENNLSPCTVSMIHVEGKNRYLSLGSHELSLSLAALSGPHAFTLLKCWGFIGVIRILKDHCLLHGLLNHISLMGTLTINSHGVSCTILWIRLHLNKIRSRIERWILSLKSLNDHFKYSPELKQNIIKQLLNFKPL